MGMFDNLRQFFTKPESEDANSGGGSATTGSGTRGGAAGASTNSGTAKPDAFLGRVLPAELQEEKKLEKEKTPELSPEAQAQQKAERIAQSLGLDRTETENLKLEVHSKGATVADQTIAASLPKITGLDAAVLAEIAAAGRGARSVGMEDRAQEFTLATGVDFGKQTVGVAKPVEVELTR